MDYQQQLREIEKENRLLRQLGTRQGFFQYYFEQLPNHRTNIECFNQVNDKHLDLFGEYRYDTYESFRNQKSVYLKTKR